MAMQLSRRSFLGLSGSSAALLAGLGLTGCGPSDNSKGSSSSDNNSEPPQGSPASTPLDQLPLPEKGQVYDNPQDYDNVQDGGIVTLPAGEVGPNWNYLSVEGNTVKMHNYWLLYMPEAIKSDATLTSFTPDPDLISNLSSSTDSGKLVVTVGINDKAQFNDGTPIDYRALQPVWTVMNGQSDAYTPSATDGYDKIESVEQGDNPKQAVITFSEPVFPYEPIVTQFLHPDAVDPDTYQTGWNTIRTRSGAMARTRSRIAPRAKSPLFRTPTGGAGSRSWTPSSISRWNPRRSSTPLRTVKLMLPVSHRQVLRRCSPISPI
jgi:peptide/nickel transport system substrate-binding protein